MLTRLVVPAPGSKSTVPLNVPETNRLPAESAATEVAVSKAVDPRRKAAGTVRSSRASRRGRGGPQALDAGRGFGRRPGRQRGEARRARIQLAHMEQTPCRWPSRGGEQ